MPKLQLTSPNGGTLNTAGTYCDSDIEIIPKLQEKTVTENGTVIADEGFVGFGKMVIDVQSGGGGTAKAPLVISSANINDFPVVNGFFAKISDGEFTRQELEKTMLFLSVKGGTGSFSVIAPQSYFEAVYGDEYTEHESFFLMVGEQEGCLVIHETVMYVPPENEGVAEVPKGLYFNKMIADGYNFTAIINYA